MGTLVASDGVELLEDGLPGCCTNIREVVRSEFGEHILIKFRLQIL
jgi:hypothetical protein